MTLPAGSPSLLAVLSALGKDPISQTTMMVLLTIADLRSAAPSVWRDAESS